MTLVCVPMCPHVCFQSVSPRVSTLPLSHLQLSQFIKANRGVFQRLTCFISLINDLLQPIPSHLHLLLPAQSQQSLLQTFTCLGPGFTNVGAYAELGTLARGRARGIPASHRLHPRDSAPQGILHPQVFDGFAAQILTSEQDGPSEPGAVLTEPNLPGCLQLRSLLPSPCPAVKSLSGVTHKSRVI